jgi:hypothetical protein
MLNRSPVAVAAANLVWDAGETCTVLCREYLSRMVVKLENGHLQSH